MRQNASGIDRSAVVAWPAIDATREVIVLERNRVVVPDARAVILEDILSVRVGGVIFENELGFDVMYRAAEQQLSNAESSGGIEIACMPESPSTPAAIVTAH